MPEKGELRSVTFLLLLGSVLVLPLPSTVQSTASRRYSVGDVLFTFSNRDMEWNFERHELRELSPVARRSPVTTVEIEVRQVPVPGRSREADSSQARMRGLFLKEGTIAPGHLVGCYTGRWFNKDQVSNRKKRKYFPLVSSYTIGFNDTHTIDPTDPAGEMPELLADYIQDEDGSPRSFMPLANEPGFSQLPNIVATDLGCKDRAGIRSGVAFYAFREISPGEELLWCYGLKFKRDYDTVCNNATFDDEHKQFAHKVFVDLGLIVLAGGNQLHDSVSRPVGEVLLTFRNNDVEWDPVLDRPRDLKGRPASPRVVFEVRRVAVPDTTMLLRSVFLKQGKLAAGHLVGCYTGAWFNGDDPKTIEKRRRYPAVGDYSFNYNETHIIDPTNLQGQMPDEMSDYKVDQEGKPRSKMPLINEPLEGKLPNIVILDEGWCKDRRGIRSGLPYYAFRDINIGDELSTCYGMSKTRPYATVCSQERFDDEYYTWAGDLINLIVLPEGDERTSHLPPQEDLEAMIEDYNYVEELHDEL